MTSPKASPKTSPKCVKRTTKKYAKRPSPAFPANECCGRLKMGNDKKMWRSVANKNGVCTWRPASKK